METQKQSIVAHPQGEQPAVEVRSAIADTFAGRIHVEWDAAAPVTPFGQLPFFIDYLKQGGRDLPKVPSGEAGWNGKARVFDAWVADCPLLLISPNCPEEA
jgi:hypothetical protein